MVLGLEQRPNSSAMQGLTSREIPIAPPSPDIRTFKERGKIEFPRDIEGASWKIGTGPPTFRINNSDSLMIFHGIEKEGKRYSLYRAMLHKDKLGLPYLGEVDKKQLLTPRDLYINGHPCAPELHEGREVIYSTGGVIIPDWGDKKSRFFKEKVLLLFVNAGDRKTVPVLSPFDELMNFGKHKPPFEMLEVEGLDHQINGAAWLTSFGDIIYLPRWVTKAAPEGKPDKGPLAKLRLSRLPVENQITEFRIRKNVILDSRVVWTPEGKRVLLEDTRGITLENGGVWIGSTGVTVDALKEKDREDIKKSIEELKEKTILTKKQIEEFHCLGKALKLNKKEFPHPTFIILDSKDDFSEIKNEVVLDDRGKNAMPLDDKNAVYRKEGDENNFTITVLSSTA